MEVLYFYERHPYRADELKRYLNNNEKTIAKLKYKGVLKSYKEQNFSLAELLDSDEITDNSVESTCYGFVYVGIIVVDKFVLYILPKYLPYKRPDYCDESLISCIKQVVSVLEKYNRDNRQHIGFGQQDTGNLLPLMVFLLRDYYENGIYSNNLSVNSLNGEGDIIWDNTIDECQPLIINKSPVYADFITCHDITDRNNLFKLLHECILTDCSMRLENTGLAEILGITPVNLNPASLHDFGEKEYLYYRIDSERKSVFNTRKLLLLYSFEQYIKEMASAISSEDVDMFATKSFHMVWERACADVFSNKFNSRISDVLPNWKNEQRTFEEYMPRPQWISNTNSFFSDGTLIPDIIVATDKEFFILDAKYYNVKFENGLVEGFPGVQDIAKQFMYMDAYRPLLMGQYIPHNIFLFPSGENGFQKGKVSITFSIFKGKIDVVWCSAKEVFACYLSGNHISSKELL